MGAEIGDSNGIETALPEVGGAAEKNNSREPLERVKAKQAAKELNMDIEALHYLMQKERLPIGYAVKRDGCKKHTYYIYRTLLDAYIEKIKKGIVVDVNVNLVQGQ